MKENKKFYWKGIEQLTNDPEFVKNAEKEFPEYLPVNENNGSEEGASRRDFLKMMGFGIAAASLAACEAPIRKAIPYVNKPVDVDPGIPNYYASTYVSGGDAVSIVVKTREGRPIKIEGNKLSKITQGGVSAQTEASVLSLYDKGRLQYPIANGEKVEWNKLDSEIIAGLTAVANKGGQIRIVSNTYNSPTGKKAIAEFVNKYPTAKHVAYDAISVSGLLEANKESLGEAIVPSYDFSKAKTIVSFGADFLGTWISPIEFTKQYSSNRKVNAKKKEMSRHYQFEANLSLTGANADYRLQVKPSKEGLVVAALYDLVAKKAGAQSFGTTVEGFEILSQVANELWANRGKSLVVAGSNDKNVQLTVNAINQLLGNYGTTIDTSSPILTRQGSDAEMSQFVKELEAGRIGAVIFLNANPVYDFAEGAKIANAISKAQLSVSIADRVDETAALTQFVAPSNHYLESWGDVEIKPGHFSLMQPAISPLFDTRQAEHSFLVWAGVQVEDYYTYLMQNWNERFFNLSGLALQSKWDAVLHDGVYTVSAERSALEVSNASLSGAVSSIRKTYKADSEGFELVLYPTVALGSGTHANNPWLQEMPDPITKAVWDNYVTISQKQANELGIKTFEGKANMVDLTVGDQKLRLPVVVQPGQTYGTLGLALGYGREKAGKAGNGVGKNAYTLVSLSNGAAIFNITADVKLEVLAETYQVAQTQTHNTYMGRATVIQEATLAEYKEDSYAGRYQPKIATRDGMVKPSMISLWKGHDYNNHHWGLIIDLNSCTGCGACTVACQAENNIPVVGRQEVINRREMTWLRIDRYYSTEADTEDKSISGYKAMEIASENPEVVFQPMMCQHCNNAPCETVCPVVATTHSSEGLNQMTYNRCIGTRYCANNCPYKVRRFNWFKYHDNKQFKDVNYAMYDDLGKMVLNPDVTVRSRGVMEKCSMCAQRIQAGKLSAKKDGRRPVDGEINTACAAACTAGAIIFGDMNDPESKISQQLQVKKEEKQVVVGEERAYHVLEEINVLPNVYYLTKIKNKDKESAKA